MAEMKAVVEAELEASGIFGRARVRAVQRERAGLWSASLVRASLVSVSQCNVSSRRFLKLERRFRAHHKGWVFGGQTALGGCVLRVQE